MRTIQLKAVLGRNLRSSTQVGSKVIPHNLSWKEVKMGHFPRPHLSTILQNSTHPTPLKSQLQEKMGPLLDSVYVGAFFKHSHCPCPTINRRERLQGNRETSSKWDEEGHKQQLWSLQDVRNLGSPTQKEFFPRTAAQQTRQLTQENLTILLWVIVSSRKHRRSKEMLISRREKLWLNAQRGIPSNF